MLNILDDLKTMPNLRELKIVMNEYIRFYG
jgi:hypothetical protein